MPLLTLTLQTFLRLQRSLIFIPIFLAQVLLVSFAFLAGEWGIDSSAKIFADVVLFGIHLIGHGLAIFWSVQTVAEGRLDGSLQFELAAPIPRELWVLSRFFGVSLVLILFAATTLLLWAGFDRAGFFGHWQTILGVVFLQCLSWIVIAGIAVLLATFSGTITALFVSCCAWGVGEVTQVVADNFPVDYSPELEQVVNAVAYVWNLQRFNLVPYEGLSMTTLVATSLYALGWILGSLALSCLVFSRRDIVL